MDQVKIANYSLYQSFSQNMPKSNLTVNDKEFLEKSISKLTAEQNIAIFRLMLEHSRVSNADSNTIVTEIPYNGVESNEVADDTSKCGGAGKVGTNEVTGGVTFEFKNIPRELQWIILKFVKVCLTESV